MKPETRAARQTRERLEAERLLAAVRATLAADRAHFDAAVRRLAAVNDAILRKAEGRASVAEEAAALRRLDLQPGATRDEVLQAYRRNAKQAHPDGGGSAAAFVALKTDRDLALGGCKDEATP